MLVLKRVADARGDGDEILAVIAGSAVNHDGRSKRDAGAQSRRAGRGVAQGVQERGIDPRTVDYIEAHGTGTILGDPIEADARAAWLERVAPAGPALLAAVKSNVGHLESAAGAPSLAKMTLALKNNKLLLSINYSGPNPVHRLRRRAPEGRRHRHRLAALQWARYRGCSRASASAAPTHTWCFAKAAVRSIVEPEPELDDASSGKHAAPMRRRVRRWRADGRVRGIRRRGNRWGDGGGVYGEFGQSPSTPTTASQQHLFSPRGRRLFDSTPRRPRPRSRTHPLCRWPFRRS